MIDFSSGEWEGLEDMGDEIIRELKPRVLNLVKDGAVMAEATVKQTLTGARSGRMYIVSETGAPHVASAPGEPPAVLFGHLRNSVGHTEPKWVGDGAESRFGPGLGVKATGEHNPDEYATILEYGGVTRHGVRILPRPYLEPSVNELEPLLERLFGGL